MLEISVLPDDEMRELERPSLNRLCNTLDWSAWGPLSNVMNEMQDSVTIHRKSWEYALCVFGLRQLGVVADESVALAVGAGYERPLYLFANTVGRMVATDLYDNPEHEGRPDMVTNPDRYAPFAYRRERLEVMQMSGDNLRFDDDTFDFAFCLSSIEHFGSRETQRNSLDEMRRVTRRGGVLSIATELILNDGSHHEYFRPDELAEMFLEHPRLELVGGDLDLRIQQSLIDYPIDLNSSQNVNASPHVTVLTDGCLITSVMLFLRVV